jgi:hypothetical protein
MTKIKEYKRQEIGAMVKQRGITEIVPKSKTEYRQ